MNSMHISRTVRHIPACQPSTSGRQTSAPLAPPFQRKRFETLFSRREVATRVAHRSTHAAKRRDDDYFEVTPEIVDDVEKPKAWPAVLPALGAVAVASLFGPVLLAFVAGIAGLGVAFAAGTLAFSIVLPFALTLGGLFFIGSILQASFAVALLAGPLLFGLAAYQMITKGNLGFTRNRRKRRRRSASASDARAAEAKAREAAWERDQREAEQMVKEELRSFDELLKSRERQREGMGRY